MIENSLLISMMTLSPGKFGQYALILCGFGIILPILILLTSETPDEFFGNPVMALMLAAVPAIALLLGILGWRTLTGKLGIGFAIFLIFAIFFLSVNSKVTIPKKNQTDFNRPPQKRR